MNAPHALATLTAINLDDLVDSFGWQGQPLLAAVLRRLFYSPARTFAGQMLDFDATVGAQGLAGAAYATLANYARSLRVHNADQIPTGPFLALSNHPGMTDTLALFTALGRPGLKIIAVENPFLQALPHTSRQLYFVSEEPVARMALVRRVSAHLRSGGAALTFPAGSIEPDPQVYPGAVAALGRWTDSVGVFVRLAPETAILPVLVRGVIWERAARHPLTRLKRTGPEKEKLAAALQLLAHVQRGLKPVDVSVQFGRAITMKELGTTETGAIHSAVLREMRRLIENPPADEGQVVL